MRNRSLSKDFPVKSLGIVQTNLTELFATIIKAQQNLLKSEGGQLANKMRAANIPVEKNAVVGSF